MNIQNIKVFKKDSKDLVQFLRIKIKKKFFLLELEVLVLIILDHVNFLKFINLVQFHIEDLINQKQKKS